MSNAIKEYWDQRARQAAESPTATTNDVHLRELEIRTLVQRIQACSLPDGASVVDVGCGDGYSTLRLAGQFPRLRFTGVDYSEAMIATARRRHAEVAGSPGHPVEFHLGDATMLTTLLPPQSVDVVLTDRCLINLTSAEAQYDAIRQIHGVLRSDGRYIAIENFNEGQKELNQTRGEIGLPEIPVRWHNLFFGEEEFLGRTRAIFRQVEIVNFSSAYYYATRVIYSKYCQIRGEEPDYDHELHRLAVALPAMGAFSPIKLAILHK